MGIGAGVLYSAEAVTAGVKRDGADAVGKVWRLGSDTTKDPGPRGAGSATCGGPPSGNAVVQRRQPAPVAALLLNLGLQRKARCEGIPTPVPGLQEVHQLR